MAVYTQATLDALDVAIASSQLEVQFGDRRVRYRSMDELLAARQHVARELSAAAGKSGGNRRFVFATMRGD
jgi:hypothetical protein